MDAYEERLRRALRWYPRHYRERHGEEIVATALDLRAPGSDAVDRAELRGLAVAGLRTRLRERPPPGAWARYRFLGTRVPYRHRMWVRDDVTGRGYAARRIGWSLAALLVPVVLLSPLAVLVPMATGVDPWGTGHTMGLLPKAWENITGLGLLWGVVWFGLQGFGRRDRTSTLRRHDFHPDGRPVSW
jgi:hypothetical protein